MKNDFTRGKVDTNMLYKLYKSAILIVQIYVDDIIFGSSNAIICQNFSKSMHVEF